MTISFRSAYGQTFTRTLSRDGAIARLASLDWAEDETRRYAPTDTGTTRFNYNAEADAIRAAFGLPAYEPFTTLEPPR